MDPLGNNKIFAAILGGALVFMMIRMLPEFFLHTEAPSVPAYMPSGVEMPGPGEEEPLPFPQAAWVEAMDAERGARVFANCTSCHNADEGGANGTGPGLWNVVGATMGTHEGFAYSNAMASDGRAWDYETLDAFLAAPKRWLPGTKMNYLGLKKEEDRAAVIEYLRLANDNPPPRPTPAPAELELSAEVEDAAALPEEGIAQDPTLDPSEMDDDNISDEGMDAIIDQETLQDEAEVMTQEEQDEVE